jgi:hypothetical protein
MATPTLTDEERRMLLVVAYETVFGAEGRRSDAQKLVMADLEMHCGYNDNHAKQNPKDGMVDPWATHWMAGKHAVLVEIKKILKYAANPTPLPTVNKPTKRKRFP